MRRQKQDDPVATTWYQDKNIPEGLEIIDFGKDKDGNQFGTLCRFRNATGGFEVMFLAGYGYNDLKSGWVTDDLPPNFAVLELPEGSLVRVRDAATGSKYVYIEGIHAEHFLEDPHSGAPVCVPGELAGAEEGSAPRVPDGPPRTPQGVDAAE